MPFKGNTKLTSGIKQKNNLTFALVDSADIYVEDDDSAKKYKSLAEKLAEIDTSTSTGVDTKIKNAIEALDVEDTSVDKQFVTVVSETNGKISVSRAQPTASDIDGLETAIDSKINDLDVSDSAVTNQFVTAVSEENGKISVSRSRPTADNIDGLTTAINNEINKLDVSDSAVENQFVTAVSETNGKISITRAQPSVSDISGLTDAINTEINKLDVSDTKVDHQFVTVVSETNGKISVNRSQPSSSDISDFTTAVNTEINKLDVTDEAVENQFVTVVSETDGKVSISRAQPTIGNVNGLQDALDSKQGNLSEGTGISIESNTVAITDEVNQNVVGSTGYTDLSTTLGVSYSSSEHKMETVLDNLADRAIDYDDRLGILEYSNFTVSGGSCVPTEAENGDVITEVTLKWYVSVPSLPGETKHPRKQEIRNSNGSTIIKEVESVSARQTSISSLNITAYTSWRMYAYITDSLSKYTSGSITFKDRLYYGHKQMPSSSSEYNQEFIRSLQNSNKLVTSSSYKSVFGTITFSMSSDEYAYIAIPTSYGVPTFSIDGSSTVLFTVKENITYKNGSVITEYNIYESPNSGGSYTITLL